MLFLQNFTKTNPQKLFFLDSLGALLSAIMLGLVLAGMESFFGIPKTLLYCLSAIASLFFIHSLAWFLVKSVHWKTGMKIVAFANLAYLFITLALAVFCYPEIKVAGFLYFLLECSVILVLVRIELGVAYGPKAQNL